MAARGKSIQYFIPKLCANPMALWGKSRATCTIGWMAISVDWHKPFKCDRAWLTWQQLSVGSAHEEFFVPAMSRSGMLETFPPFQQRMKRDAATDADQVCETPCSELPLTMPSSNSSAASPQVLLRVRYEPESRKCNPADGWGRENWHSLRTCEENKTSGDSESLQMIKRMFKRYFSTQIRESLHMNIRT